MHHLYAFVYSKRATKIGLRQIRTCESSKTFRWLLDIDVCFRS